MKKMTLLLSYLIPFLIGSVGSYAMLTLVTLIASFINWNVDPLSVIFKIEVIRIAILLGFVVVFISKTSLSMDLDRK